MFGLIGFGVRTKTFVVGPFVSDLEIVVYLTPGKERRPLPL